MLFGAMNFPIRPLFEEIEIVGNLGFDYIELAMDPPEAHAELLMDQKERIREELSARGLKLVCHLPSFLYLADLDRGVREASVRETLSCLDVAAEIEPLKVVLHPAYFLGLSTSVRDLAAQYAMDSIQTIVERAEQHGLTLCVENMFPQANSLVAPDDFVPLLDRMPNLKFTLDVGHAHIGSRGNSRALGFIKRFGDRIAHVHFSDNLGRQDNHLPIGAGTIDFVELIEALKGIAYDQTITFEVFSKDKEYLTMSREKVRQMLE